MRQSNIEVLRIVSMIMIVLHHVVYHGFSLYDYCCQTDNSILMSQSNMALLAFVNSFLIYGVDIFILISGFFHIKLSVKGVVRLFFISSFYSVITNVYAYYYYGESAVSVSTVVSQVIFPFSRTKFWFVREYFILMLLSPILNNYLETADKQKKLVAIGLLGIINIWMGFVHGVNYIETGYGFVNFTLLYIIGDYIRTSNIEEWSISRYWGGYFLCSVILGFCCILLLEKPSFLAKCFYYNNPLVIMGAVCFFCVYARMKISYSPTINGIARCVLPVYLMQDGGMGFYYLYQEWLIPTMGLNIFLLALATFCVPVVIEKIRMTVFSSFESLIVSKVNNLIHK